VLLLAFGLSRGCASRSGEISREEAIEIAQQEVDYRSEQTQVRLIRRGFQSRPYWAVSLSTLDDQGAFERTTIVVIDARTREVTEIRETGP
jgi:hypothetical protein